MTKRVMIFIDGDNLLARFQAMKTNGYVPGLNVRHRQDCYVWPRNFCLPVAYPTQLIRAYYYCSVLGDEQKINSVIDEIKSLNATSETNAGNNFGGLHPVVFKKDSHKEKASGVDVRLAVDALGHIYNDNLDIVSIVSGDGDFMPVAQEAVRHGKHVHVAGLSSGLNQKWRRSADAFSDLDATFFDLDNHHRQ